MHTGPHVAAAPSHDTLFYISVAFVAFTPYYYYYYLKKCNVIRGLGVMMGLDTGRNNGRNVSFFGVAFVAFVLRAGFTIDTRPAML